jgi:hypothetical protein
MPQTDATKLYILLAEDNPAMFLIREFSARRARVELSLAENGEDAAFLEPADDGADTRSSIRRARPNTRSQRRGGAARLARNPRRTRLSRVHLS